MPPDPDPARSVLLRQAAARFLIGVTLIHLRNTKERTLRLQAENIRLMEIACQLLDARNVPDPARN